MKTLYLHIGYPKTGTTGLQEFLVTNADVLAQQGVLVPKTGLLNGAHYQFNFALNIGVYNGTKPISSPEKLKTELSREIDASPCERIIISSEYFSTAKNLTDIRAYFSDYDVKIIVYLRRHDLALESAYAQVEKMIKNPPWDQSIESYALYSLCTEDDYHNYLQTLRRWSNAFGRDALIVRPFEKEQNKPDLYADFMYLIGAIDGPELVRPKSLNTSLGRETLTAIRMVRGMDLPTSVIDTIVSRLIHTNGNTPGERYFSPAIRMAIYNKYRYAYSVIAGEYLGRSDGIFFKAPLPKLTDPWSPPIEVKPRQVMECILKAIAVPRN
jgi:hypothetical protein